MRARCASSGPSRPTPSASRCRSKKRGSTPTMVLERRAWLDAHINMERGIGIPADVARATAPTLDRMRALVELLGSPQLDIAAIHLTGTNGKTSTARITAALLRSFGLKVGT